MRLLKPLEILFRLCYNIVMENERPTLLTPEQAADVIRYFNFAENEERSRRGLLGGVAMGLSAIHATKAEHSFLPDSKPLLTRQEMGAGMDLIEKQEEDEPEFTEDEWRRIEHIVDTRGVSYDKAKRQVMDERH